MEQVNIFIRLKLPEHLTDSQSWEAALRIRLHRHGLLSEPSLFMDEEQEVMNLGFPFEGTVKLNELNIAVAETGAQVIELLFRFPLSYIDLEFINEIDDHSTLYTVLEYVEPVISVAKTREALDIRCNSSEPDELFNHIKWVIKRYKEAVKKYRVRTV